MSAERYWLSKNGEVTGPFWRGKVMQMRAAGEIGETDQLCKEGTEEWVNAEEELQFLTWAAPVSAPPVPPVAVAAPQEKKKADPALVVALVIVGGFVMTCGGCFAFLRYSGMKDDHEQKLLEIKNGKRVLEEKPTSSIWDGRVPVVEAYLKARIFDPELQITDWTGLTKTEVGTWWGKCTVRARSPLAGRWYFVVDANDRLLEMTQ